MLQLFTRYILGDTNLPPFIIAVKAHFENSNFLVRQKRGKSLASLMGIEQQHQGLLRKGEEILCEE